MKMFTTMAFVRQLLGTTELRRENLAWLEMYFVFQLHKEV